jgi:hypothetical protein
MMVSMATIEIKAGTSDSMYVDTSTNVDEE